MSDRKKLSPSANARIPGPQIYQRGPGMPRVHVDKGEERLAPSPLGNNGANRDQELKNSMVSCIGCIFFSTCGTLLREKMICIYG